jgi:gluconate 2-dehydrogenase gamma chain
MSEGINRRALLGQIAAATLAGNIGIAEAQHVHHEAVAQAKTTGVYQPKALTHHEFETLRVLSETIVPGATKGGAAEFVDVLADKNAELLAIYTGGLAWIDLTMKRDHGADFLSAKPEDRARMLDQIAYRRNETPDLAPGVRFFVWARRLTVDAYYSSAAGIKELGFMGNGARKEFTVPQDAIDYAVKRSGL